MARRLLYKAGRGILGLIRDEGLIPERIKVFAGPAGGPKWFVSVGFDHALMTTGFLGRGAGRTLLAGSSAGGWRCLAMACADPAASYERLRMAYSRNIFDRFDTPATVGDALSANVDAFLDEKDIPAILNHDRFIVAIHATLSRGPAASDNRRAEGLGIAVAALGNMVTPRSLNLFYQRVVFFSGPDRPDFLTSAFSGIGVRLTERNLRKAALATGSLPYIVRGVRDIPDAPPGVYRDGGLTDYQLNQDYRPAPEGVTLFFHYQERIVPGWFDKRLWWRTPPKGSLDRVLQVYPGPDFLRLLPDGRLPDRNDFIRFANAPGERIKRWDDISQASAALGEQFMEDVESGRIKRLVKPLEDGRPG